MNGPFLRHDGTCFVEADPSAPLIRRAAAEAIGSCLLVFTVMAAGLTWAGSAADGPIGRGLAVGPVLAGLILAFGQVSGGHFNPMITFSQWMSGRRNAACLFGYLGAQLLGASLAAKAAMWSFGGGVAAHAAAPPATQLLAEVFATAGLMTLVLAAPRMRPAGAGPFAVGGWVLMSIVGLPGAPAANPVITLAAFGCGMGLSPRACMLHLLGQAAGLVLAVAITAVTSPQTLVQRIRP